MVLTPQLAVVAGVKAGDRDGPAATHPLYDANLVRWMLCRDLHDGADAVKARGETYLPAPPPVRDLPDWYRKFLHTAPFFAALARTESALRGAVFAQPPEIEAPPQVLAQIEPADLELLASQMTTDLLLTGRACLELAVDPEENAVRWVRHEAEELVNWRLGERFVFRQTLYEPTGDGWGVKEVEQIRVVRMDGARVVVEKYRKPKGDWVLMESAPVVYSGRPLDALPVFVTGVERHDLTPDKSPLLDLASLNLAHYQLSALNMLGLTLTSLPTPYVTGLRGNPNQGRPQAPRPRGVQERSLLSGARGPQENRMQLGGASVWQLPADAKVGMLEFSGAGLDAQQEALAAMEQRMAALGARVLMPPKRAAETAESVRLKSAADTSVLHSLAIALDALMTRALDTHAMLAGSGGAVSYVSNKNFLATRLEAAEVRALVEAFEKGVLDRDTLVTKLVEAGNIPEPAGGASGRLADRPSGE